MYHNKNSGARNRVNLFIWGLVLVAMVAIAVSSAEQGPIEAGDDESIVQVGVDVSGGEVDASTDKMIQSITFEKNMQIQNALRLLGGMYKKNIVPSPNVDGVLAFRALKNVTFEEAMDAILGGKFEYEQKGNLIEVFPRGDESRMKYAVFALHYISAAEAMKLIAPVLSGKGIVGVTTAAETGVPTGESISAQTGGGDTMSLKDTLVVYDYAENIKRAEEVITAIDVRPKQVLVEATILSATLTENMQLGINWQTLKGTAVTSVSDITQGAPDFFKSVGTTTATALIGGLSVGLAIGDVATFIKAMEEISDVTILANPKILAVNKQLGQVYIGTKLGYREGDIETAGGGVQEGTVKFLDTGTKLSFRPYIGNDGYIRIDIHSKDSSGSLNVQGIPDEVSAELVSNIMVKDGQTIVIGGLFRDKVTTTKTQIPLLGDLPIIGAAFRGTGNKVERQEVIVLLTPHIIEEPSETEGEERADDVRRKRFGAKDGLQWIGRARLAEDYYAKAAKYYIEGNSEAALNELNTVLALRPTYLEALRLKEKIIRETDPDRAAKMERIILNTIERQEANKWMRR